MDVEEDMDLLIQIQQLLDGAKEINEKIQTVELVHTLIKEIVAVFILLQTLTQVTLEEEEEEDEKQEKMEEIQLMQVKAETVQ